MAAMHTKLECRGGFGGGGGGGGSGGCNPPPPPPALGKGKLIFEFNYIHAYDVIIIGHERSNLVPRTRALEQGYWRGMEWIMPVLLCLLQWKSSGI